MASPLDHGLLDHVADLLLDNLLAGNRPVLAWRTHFFQALVMQQHRARETLEWPRRGVELKPLDAQQSHYFQPHLRPFLAPKDAKPDAGSRPPSLRDDK